MELESGIVWLAAALVAVVAGVLHYRFWVRRLTLPMRYARLDRLATDDGSAIELRRLPPPPNPDLPPVLLVHGLAANHRNLDAEPDRSLARVLSAAGRDVWLVTLRSGRANRAFREPPATLEAIVRYDLPLALTHVLDTTYAKQVDYVGFSMGGVMLCAALNRSIDSALVRRAVVLGSPGSIHAPHALLKKAAWLAHALAPLLPIRFAARMLAFAADSVSTPLHRWVCNPKNLTPGSAGRAMVNLIENISTAQARDLVDWLSLGFVHLDGVNVLDRVGEATTPALFVAGEADRLAPPAAVRQVHDAWGSETKVEKRLAVIGKGHGASADYGHGDLVVGRSAVDEVFAPIRDFLAVV